MNCAWKQVLDVNTRRVLLRSRQVKYKQVKKLATIESTEPLYDVIVVGGGHAGTEAAAAAARMGCNTLLLTCQLEDLGELQFSPSLGGIARGHLVKEIDALDGLGGRICDKSAIHYKLLNRSKNPALWGPRAHVDRVLYKKLLKEDLLHLKNLEIRAGTVTDVIVNREKHLAEMGLPHCRGVILENGNSVTSKSVVLCPGTYVQRTVYFGSESKACGEGELSKSLMHHGFELGKLKIGVSARIQKHSVDFIHMSTIQGDESPIPLSFKKNSISIKPNDQVPSYITVTNADVETFLMDNAKISSSTTECEQACSSSLEAKFSKFCGQPQQIWLEPEGLICDTMYAEGLSCSLSETQQ